MAAEYRYVNSTGSSIYFVHQGKNNRWSVLRRRIAEHRDGEIRNVNGRCHTPPWAKWFDTKQEAQEYLDDYADGHNYRIIVNSNK